MSDLQTALTTAMDMQGQQDNDPADRLVDAQGRSMGPSRRDARRCPRCGTGSERRVASAGFGLPHPVCGRCGHEFLGEAWEGGTR